MKTKASSVFYVLVIGLLLLSSGCSKDDPLNVPVLTTAEVTNIGAGTAVSGGNITDDGGALVTGRGVCWSKSKTPTISDSKTDDGTGSGNFISNISGLEPNTTYHVRAFATSGKNTGYGTTYSFTTKDGVVDVQGNVYKIVTIGQQTWMAENLKYLPEVVGPATGLNTIPYYYVPSYDGKDVNAAKDTYNYKTYGVLYNMLAAMAGSASSTANPSGVQGVCPTGWHLPSDAEWTQLMVYLKGKDVAGDKLKEAGTAHWFSGNKATNETGFTALPGGSRGSTGMFYNDGSSGIWWTASEGRITVIYSNDSGVLIHIAKKESGLSVRCVKN